MATIRIPTPLRVYTNGKSEIDVQGQTVSQAIANLADNHPGIKKQILKENGELRPFVNLFKGDININDLQGLDTPLTEADRLMLVPTIAGG